MHESRFFILDVLSSAPLGPAEPARHDRVHLPRSAAPDPCGGRPTQRRQVARAHHARRQATLGQERAEARPCRREPCSGAGRGRSRLPRAARRAARPLRAQGCAHDPPCRASGLGALAPVPWRPSRGRAAGSTHRCRRRRAGRPPLGRKPAQSPPALPGPPRSDDVPPPAAPRAPCPARGDRLGGRHRRRSVPTAGNAERTQACGRGAGRAAGPISPASPRRSG